VSDRAQRGAVGLRELLVICALFASAGAGCASSGDGDGEQQTCVGDGDCREDHSCRNGVCQPNRGLGVRDAGGGEECLRADDCTSGYDCINNVCTARSADAGLDQGRGEDSGEDDRGGRGDVTADRGGREDSGGGDDRGGREDAGGADEPDESTGEPDESSGEPDESSGTPDEGPDECEGRDDGRFRESCDAASDCCEGLCLGNPEAGFGFCSQRCEGYASCNPIGLPGDDFFCLDAGGSGYLCAPSDYGDPCESTDECLGQVCLAARGVTGCSWFCSVSADCPPGSSCGQIAVSDGAGGVTFVSACAPVGTDCNINRTTGLNNCLSGTCLTPDTGGLSGYCSVFCNPGDPDACPLGFACARIEGVDVCVRPEDL
jgi:hypothetical protein